MRYQGGHRADYSTPTFPPGPVGVCLDERCPCTGSLSLPCWWPAGTLLSRNSECTTRTASAHAMSLRQAQHPAQPLILLRQPQVLHTLRARQVQQRQRDDHLAAGPALAPLIAHQVATDRVAQTGDLRQVQVGRQTGETGQPPDLFSSAYWKDRSPWAIIVAPR